MKKAFTLIELLVVISVIAILAALLMPALNKAREEARKVACKSNMHNVGLGIATFREAYEQEYPRNFQFEDLSNKWCNIWGRLYNGGHLNDFEAFNCPETENLLIESANPRSYEYTNFRWNVTSNGNNTGVTAGDYRDILNADYAYDNARIMKNSDSARVIVADNVEHVWRDDGVYDDRSFDVKLPMNHTEGANVLCVDNAVLWTPQVLNHKWWIPEQAPSGNYQDHAMAVNDDNVYAGTMYSWLPYGGDSYDVDPVLPLWAEDGGYDAVRQGLVPNPRIDEDNYVQDTSDVAVSESDDHDDIYAIECDTEPSSTANRNRWMLLSPFEYETGLMQLGYTQELTFEGWGGRNAVRVEKDKKDAACQPTRDFFCRTGWPDTDDSRPDPGYNDDRGNDWGPYWWGDQPD